MKELDLCPQANSITDAELEQLTREIVKQLSLDEVRELCQALLDLYSYHPHTVYH